MAQHDYDVANGTGLAVRTDINNVLSAIATQNSGATAPATMFANMFWYDTATSTLKKRDNTNTDWIPVATFDDTGNVATWAGGLDITGLTALTAPAVGDEFPVYDLSATANRKITFENYLKIISALTALTAPAVDDTLAIYDLSAAAPRSITTVDLLEVLNVLTEDTSPDTAADFVLTYDTSASTVKKVKPRNLSSQGGITTIASGSLSGAAVSITNIPATYAFLILQITGASSDTATRQPYVRADTDNGASYDTSASNYTGNFFDAGAVSSAGVASMIKSTTQAAASTWTASLIIQGYQAGPTLTKYFGQVEAAGAIWEVLGSWNKGVNALNALQILWDGTGSFDAGTYALYGVG